MRANANASARGARLTCAIWVVCLIGGSASGACGSTQRGPESPDTGVPAADGGGTASVDAASAAEDAALPADCSDTEQNLPADVFCIGLYVGRNTNRHPGDVHSYTPGVTLWSDGAQKQRYLSLPAGAQIDTSDMDVWKFPIGTKAFKEFRFNDKLVETRIFYKRSDTMWASGTYVWNADGTAAQLNTSRQPLIVNDGYEIPTAKDCGKCHHGGADYLLGVEAVALSLPTSEGLTLARLVEMGALSAPPNGTSIQLPEDATGHAGAALGYLHANCGMPCHSTRGLGEETQLIMRLRATEFWAASGAAAMNPQASATDTYRATLGQMPRTKSVASKFPGALRITPGAHDQSLVWILSHTRGDYQMPPLVSHKIDDFGTKALSDWIDALAP
jgi:hypothetical protein